MDISRQQSEERVKESLKKAFDLSDNIFHMRQGIRKKYLEYEFRYVQQLRSHFPDSLSGVRSENDEELLHTHTDIPVCDGMEHWDVVP